MDCIIQLLHLSLFCSWWFLSMRTFVEKRWSCLVNVKMCWRRHKGLVQSLWSRDREWLSYPSFIFTACRSYFVAVTFAFNKCVHLYVLLIFHVVRWVGFERPSFAGELFVLEKGEYPRWSTWTNCQSSYSLSSFRPLKVVCTWNEMNLRHFVILQGLMLNMWKYTVFCRTVQITSYICLRMLALKAEKWRLLMMMSPVCGLMVSKTVWPVLRLSMERKFHHSQSLTTMISTYQNWSHEM